MLYRINAAVAHPDHTVTVTWSDGITAAVDLAPVVAKGNVFASMQDSKLFVETMRVAADHLGLEWPNRVDFSADGLRFRAFPEEAEAEFSQVYAPASQAPDNDPASSSNTPKTSGR